MADDARIADVELERRADCARPGCTNPRQAKHCWCVPCMRAYTQAHRAKRKAAGLDPHYRKKNEPTPSTGRPGWTRVDADPDHVYVEDRFCSCPLCAGYRRLFTTGKVTT